jgi:hypothetical protein
MPFLLQMQRWVMKQESLNQNTKEHTMEMRRKVVQVMTTYYCSLTMAETWMNTSHPWFEGETPSSMIEKGKHCEVRKLIKAALDIEV